MDLGLVKFGILKSFVYMVQGATEKIRIQFLKLVTGDRGTKVDSFLEQINLNTGLEERVYLPQAVGRPWIALLFSVMSLLCLCLNSAIK